MSLAAGAFATLSKSANFPSDLPHFNSWATVDHGLGVQGTGTCTGQLRRPFSGLTSSWGSPCWFGSMQNSANITCSSEGLYKLCFPDCVLNMSDPTLHSLVSGLGRHGTLSRCANVFPTRMLFGGLSKVYSKVYRSLSTLNQHRDGQETEPKFHQPPSPTGSKDLQTLLPTPCGTPLPQQTQH